MSEDKKVVNLLSELSAALITLTSQGKNDG